MKSKPQADPHESMRQRLYEAQSLKCQDNVHSVQQEFDKSILTLSAGLLGISLAFVKDIVPLQSAINLHLLYASWGCAVGAVIFTLISFQASKSAFNAQLDVLFKQFTSGEQEPPTRSALITRWLTYGEATCFLLAVLLTVGFAVTNIQKVAEHGSIAPGLAKGPATLSTPRPDDSQVPKTVPSGERVK